MTALERRALLLAALAFPLATPAAGRSRPGTTWAPFPPTG